MVPRTQRNKNGYWKVLIVNMVSRTGKNEKRVREDIESEYSFSYWKKWKAGIGSYIIMSTVSRTGNIDIRVRVAVR